MNVLCPGFESELRVDLLLRMTDIRSPDKIAAIKRRLCERKTLAMAADMHGVDRKNLERAVATVERAAKIYEALKEEEGVTKLTAERRRSVRDLETRIEILTARLAALET